MTKSIKLLMILATLAMIVLNCQNGTNPVVSQHAEPSSLSLISLPDGAVFESATFMIYAQTPNGATINLHRINAPWMESVVTWNNFGSSYETTIEGSFVNDYVGWHSVDVTSLVQGWIEGSYENYGLLLEGDADDVGVFYASEWGTARPRLEVCYSLPSGPECVIVQRGLLGEVADAFIRENDPDFNGGNHERLYVGMRSGLKKHSLIEFELPEFRQVCGIGDTVWIDENRDGIQGPDELGFPEVEVLLFNCFDELIATTLTDENGFYMFDDLTPGDYYVQFIEPEGYDITLQDQGADDAKDSDADPATGLTVCTNLENNEYDMTWDCGLYLLEMEGCTLTQGFWKNHDGTGPQADVVSPLLQIWLGTPGGEKSLFINSTAISHAIFVKREYGGSSNGIAKLYAQMLAAKYNMANGADYTDIMSTLDEADAFLADHDWHEWKFISKAEKGVVIGWMSTFDQYNNGDIGPGHCDEDGEDD